MLVDKIKFGTFKKTPPIINLFIEGIKNNYNFIKLGFIFSKEQIYLKPEFFRYE